MAQKLSCELDGLALEVAALIARLEEHLETARLAGESDLPVLDGFERDLFAPGDVPPIHDEMVRHLCVVEGLKHTGSWPDLSEALHAVGATLALYDGHTDRVVLSNLEVLCAKPPPVEPLRDHPRTLERLREASQGPSHAARSIDPEAMRGVTDTMNEGMDLVRVHQEHTKGR